MSGDVSLFEGHFKKVKVPHDRPKMNLTQRRRRGGARVQRPALYEEAEDKDCPHKKTNRPPDKIQSRRPSVIDV